MQAFPLLVSLDSQASSAGQEEVTGPELATESQTQPDRLRLFFIGYDGPTWQLRGCRPA